jgi:hypothetical protein
VKGNKNPSERKHKPSSAPKFTISDVLADPILPHRLSPTPVFLGFPFHRWRGGVLALDPSAASASSGNAHKAHLASVREHERAVLLVEVLIEAKPR